MNIAQGRLDYGPPVAVIDIGSNSVRLVAYEGLTRSPTPIFNEKVLAGLGREVQTTGLLAPDAVENRHKFIYIPFAAGPRHCIGENFSLHEMMLDDRKQRR